MTKTLARKVILYTVREERLLVIRHVDHPPEEVGIQVPAGTVQTGEAPAAAAMRELVEETGYNCFEVVRFLGVAHYDLTPYRSELQERHFFLAQPTAPLPDRWMSTERHDGKASPTRFECFWIPISQGHILQSGQGVLLWTLFA